MPSNPSSSLTPASSRFDPSGEDARGFTLIELLVVIAVIAILASLLLPALAKAKQQGIIVDCKNNERQQLLALTMYAHDNKDFLPDDTGAYQPWDLRDFSGDYLSQSGAPYKVWYDPGTAQYYSDKDYLSFWNSPYAERANDPVLRVIGYTETLSGIGGYQNGGLEFSTNVNLKLNSEPISLGGKLYAIIPSARVLTACCALANGESEKFAQMQRFAWNGLPHSYDQDVPGEKPFTSSHLNGRVPAGGNMGMCDGHVEWRRFQEFIPRASVIGLTYYF